MEGSFSSVSSLILVKYASTAARAQDHNVVVFGTSLTLMGALMMWMLVSRQMNQVLCILE